MWKIKAPGVEAMRTDFIGRESKVSSADHGAVTGAIVITDACPVHIVIDVRPSAP